MADPKDATGTRTIRVEALTRVEGEGGLHVRLCGDRVEDVQLTIFEPPRLFEALLRGRALEEVPDITARICGICPVAYQMSAVHALEAALGVTPSAEVRRLRRLLYCGEWIESHVLHMHLLHAPDFLGYESGLALARDYPDQVNRGLRLKKHGNRLLEVLGGRAIHPVNVAVGGFYRAPRAQELAALVPDFEWGLQAAVDITRWVAGFDFPAYERSYRMLALVHPDEYAMNEGQIMSTDGAVIDVAEYEQHYEERHVPHSTALHSVRKVDGSCYFVGPLARVNLSLERLSPTARRLADEVGITWPCRNTFQAIVARGLELVHACEEALDILRTYRPPNPPRAAYSYRSGSGCAATEAPRGLIYHRYGIDAGGLVTEAKIVPPTSQNQAQIEEDLRHWLPRLLDRPEPEMTLACERLVRNYDPCISCSTHFLRLTLERRRDEK
ncbi:MAG TPA: Ni/Fe hydrogenase subunit alpha [Pirellulales bacterium]|jgi:coenzyme F420-reducing hydrogenase alpha subunit|nr:Ni/Fe hydrogenase subunit alpha [Pirellulales bacterium]